ncbi:glycerophosphodiester phosphodiesterase family protein, partial [Arthrospira platensis SPKY1]|nr:glycerophosphodiester phosphodiesterase family protein [Arthrospira platensis SPKY1]
ELMPQMQMDLRLGQLVGYNEWQTTCKRDSSGSWVTVDSDWMLMPEGLKKIATYADGVGVAISLLYAQDNNGNVDSASIQTLPEPAAWIKQAKQLGLVVHTYTLRADALPPF